MWRGAAWSGAVWCWLRPVFAITALVTLHSAHNHPNIGPRSGSEETSELSVRRCVETAASELFGECGAAALGVSVLSAGPSRALLRVEASALRRLRAALALSTRVLRVRACSPSLLTLV